MTEENLIESQQSFDDKDLTDLKENDTIVQKNKNSVTVEQDEFYLSYIISGLLKNEDSGKFFSRKTLNSKPPILTIIDSNENEVNFELTQNFTKNLKYALSQVDNAYNGLSYYIDENETFLQKIKNIPRDAKKHPIKYGLIALLIFTIIFMALMN